MGHLLACSSRLTWATTGCRQVTVSLTLGSMESLSTQPTKKVCAVRLSGASVSACRLCCSIIHSNLL